MISIIIVTYNSSDTIGLTLQSITTSNGYENVEVIVVDNQSTDNTKSIINKYVVQDRVKLVESDKNMGFSKANNLGVSYSKFDAILILNPDVIFNVNTIEWLIGKLNYVEVGKVLQCRLLNTDKSSQFAARSFLSFKEFLLVRTPINKIMTNKYVDRINNKYLLADIDKEGIYKVDWFIGAFMFMSRFAYESVNGFSEEYFLYFEDMDLCKKLGDKGFDIEVDNSHSVIHVYSQDSTKKLSKTTFLHFSSMLKYYKKFNLKIGD